MAGHMRCGYVAGAVLAAAVLAGCGSGGHGDGHGSGSAQGAGRTPATTAAATSTAPAPAPPPVPPATASIPTTATTPATATPSAGTATTDLHACYDGTCEITVSRPVTIPVDGRFGFSAFKVTHIGPDGVTIEANGGGTHLESGVSPGGTAALNGILVRVGSVHGGTADLSISHR
ncbi:hypothetical protein [Streptomyces sp. NPDC087270]|uniref:hypothetical protein n=1 Tax=Streptomyces sp. NPDC087270 TaxID=3365774 RepID=UPI003817CC1D